MTAYSIKRTNNRESAEARRQREEREREHAKYYIWACAGCGPCETSRGSWCDKGCGSDYPGMIELPRHMLKRIQDEASKPALEALAWSQNMTSTGEVASLVGMLHDAKAERDKEHGKYIAAVQATTRAIKLEQELAQSRAEAAILREEVNATRYLADGTNFPDPHDADQYRYAKARLMKAKRATDAIGEVAT